MCVCVCVCVLCARYPVTLHKAEFHNTYMKIDWSATSFLWRQFLFRDCLLHLLSDHATPITFPNCVKMAKKIAPRSLAFVCYYYTITRIFYNLATSQRSTKWRGTSQPERATDWSLCFLITRSSSTSTCPYFCVAVWCEESKRTVLHKTELSNQKDN
jgi:hypothetical protein